MEKIKEFEKQYDAKVVYLTLSGSKLYGTDNENSDTDYKGIFIPSIESVLTKTDIKTYSNNTNNENTKNSKGDIDFTLHSIYSFFNQLAKSETGGVDVLFSMFREDTIVYEDKNFTDLIKNNYKLFLNKNLKSFIGYALGQAKKYGIKGAKFDELKEFKEFVDKMPSSDDIKLGEYKDDIEKILKEKSFKHIKFVTTKEGVYLSVLGKLSLEHVSVNYFKNNFNHLFNQFGDRTKKIAQTKTKTDFKALSHSLRIAQEVKELLETEFIKFPLKNASEIKDIKEGKANPAEVVEKVEETLAEVDGLIENSSIPIKADDKKIKELLLKTLKLNQRRKID